MLRDDAATLAWVTPDSKCTITLEQDKGKYWVKLIADDGSMVVQIRYDKLREALANYITWLPLDA